MSCSLRKKKQGFLNCLFCPKDIFLASVFNLNVVYWIHFQNIRASTYQKNYLINFFACFWNRRKPSMYPKELHYKKNFTAKVAFWNSLKFKEQVKIFTCAFWDDTWLSLKFFSILVVFSLWCKNISGLSQFGKAWKCVISQSDSRLW